MITRQNIHYTKSQVAFLLTCQKMFEVWPRCYFWTFTFVNVMPDWYYPNHWHLFIQHLNNLHGGMIMGVRTIEPHTSHGLHYHAIINIRVSIHLVLRVAKIYGIGRVSAEACNYGAAEYLVGYLKPTEDTRIAAGMRRWGTIGGFKGVKTNNIEVDSPFHRNMKLLNNGKKVGFKICHEVYRFTRLLGDLHEWDEHTANYIRAVAMPNCSQQVAFFHRKKMPHRHQRVASPWVATKPGTKKYQLNPHTYFSPLHKPEIDEPGETQYLHPVVFQKVMQHNFLTKQKN